MVRSRQITAKLLFKTLKLFSVFFVSEMGRESRTQESEMTRFAIFLSRF
jgi:hypothetical protein